MDAVVSQDVRHSCVRSSRVVLIPRRWDQASGDYPFAMVAKEPGHQGERGVSRKAIAQGVPERFGLT
jgi:hypothetical protein